MISSRRLMRIAAGTGAVGCLLAFSALGRQAAQSALRVFSLSAEEREILDHLSIVYLDDGRGGTVKTIDVAGVNLRIHNGSGATNGYPDDPESVDEVFVATNGLGNLIIGPYEPGQGTSKDRTGSHNVIVGNGHGHSSFGGIVAARENLISAPFASVLGGHGNEAMAPWSAVSAGFHNVASAVGASIGGGRWGSASGIDASISGGSFNYSSAYRSSVSAGSSNFALGYAASISGGYLGAAQGDGASTSGGYGGFSSNAAIGFCSSISDGYWGTATGRFSALGGGSYNRAPGDSATVSGGHGRTASGTADWRAGGLFEDY